MKIQVRHKNHVTVWLICLDPWKPLRFWDFVFEYDQSTDGEGSVSATRSVTPAVDPNPPPSGSAGTPGFRRRYLELAGTLYLAGLLGRLR